MTKLAVTVRFSCGTYIARGGGKTASCTAGADRVVRKLALKLFPPVRWEARELPNDFDDSGYGRSIWEVTADEKHAA
jgi:hypothetical protein